MEFFREYALLVAVATPVLVIVAMQVYLFATGERGTLLLPSHRAFEAITLKTAAKPEAAIESVPPRTVHSANSEHDALDRIAA
jgi:hypothetical protein